MIKIKHQAFAHLSMGYKKMFFILALLLSFANNTIKAQDASRLRISLLTCTPGDELYSIFGHSAIRIIDSTSLTDYTFNFGTFDFDDEGFYIKFMRGKLLYFVSIERTDDFIQSYMAMNRGVTEQVLDLSATEKIALQHKLLENAKEENKFYKYDFFLDNCTTRLRDFITHNIHPTPALPAVMPANTSYRDAIHQYLDKGHQPWSELGIDILLGCRTDKIMTAAEQEFLPDNLMSAIDSCRNKKLVQKKSVIYQQLMNNDSATPTSPAVLFTALFIFVTLITLINNRFSSILVNIFDNIFFFAVGWLGLLLILMWVATDHSMTKDNFNLLWALPTHLLLPFLKKSSTSFAHKYFSFSFYWTAATLLFWFFLPQQLNIALLPIDLIIFIRTGDRLAKIKKANKAL